jgi:hypothetical protein
VTQLLFKDFFYFDKITGYKLVKAYSADLGKGFVVKISLKLPIWEIKKLMLTHILRKAAYGFKENFDWEETFNKFLLYKVNNHWYLNVSL